MLVKIYVFGCFDIEEGVYIRKKYGIVNMPVTESGNLSFVNPVIDYIYRYVSSDIPMPK